MSEDKDTIAHVGLPVPGYRPQTAAAVEIVTDFKFAEERILRSLDMLREDIKLADPRWLAIGRTDLEKAFMAINRAVFRPTRVQLPEDTQTGG